MPTSLNEKKLEKSISAKRIYNEELLERTDCIMIPLGVQMFHRHGSEYDQEGCREPVPAQPLLCEKLISVTLRGFRPRG